jgi:FkbM family methyltransferase
MSDLIATLDNYLGKGLAINTVYDIGAHNGSWSKWVRSSILPSSNFFLFEANQVHLSELMVTGMNYFIDILSSEDKEFVEFYNSDTTGDSYYKENTTWFDGKPPIRKNCTTIDRLIEQHNLPIPNLLKIDTQGSELDILSGAKKILGKTELIVCEMPIIEYNLGAPTFSEYLKFFSSYDYLPIDVIEVHRAEGILLQLDLIFMLRSTKTRILGENKTIRV